MPKSRWSGSLDCTLVYGKRYLDLLIQGRIPYNTNMTSSRATPGHCRVITYIYYYRTVARFHKTLPDRECRE